LRHICQARPIGRQRIFGRITYKIAHFLGNIRHSVGLWITLGGLPGYFSRVNFSQYFPTGASIEPLYLSRHIGIEPDPKSGGLAFENPDCLIRLGTPDVFLGVEWRATTITLLAYLGREILSRSLGNRAGGKIERAVELNEREYQSNCKGQKTSVSRHYSISHFGTI
jgi:hypothetical protein